MNFRVEIKLRSVVVLFLSATCFLWSGTPAAQAATAELGPSIMISEGKSPQGFPYMHGGVGTAEREYMEERAKTYNVKFVFADKRGPYLAGVKIVLEGQNKAEIVNTSTDGPWFYIQLPPGTYTLKVTFGPKTNEIKGFKVSKDKKIYRTLIWDVSGDPDPVTVR